MPRVKRGTTHVKKRRKLLKQAGGFHWGNKNLIKRVKETLNKAGAHAYKDRRRKKRTARGLWNIKINAALRELDTTYSKFINNLKKNKIELDRKILADLAENEPGVFKKIVNTVVNKS